MKYIKKVFNLPIIKYIHFIFFLYQYLFRYIHCNSRCNECTSTPSTCPSDCRKSFYDDNKYFYCTGITSSSTNRYFYIYKYNDANGNECHLIDKCPDKVVAETLECVPNCTHYNEVGDFCYNPDTFDNDKYTPIFITANRKKYKCKNYTYIEIIDGKEFHRCFDIPEDCPTSYYNSDEKLCDDNSCKDKKIVENDSGKIECRNECYVGEYEYEKKKDVSDEESEDSESSNIFCLKKCPNKAPYYYKIPNIPPKCLEKCNEKDFYNENNECISRCDDENKIYYLKDSTHDFFFCKTKETTPTGTNGCPSDHPYRYKNACLKSCYYTLLTKFFNKETYLDANKKICVDDCYIEKGFLSDTGSLTCVESCKETNNPYYYNNKCYNSCNNVTVEDVTYYIKYSLDLSTENVDNEFECVKPCPIGFFKYSINSNNNICLKICPKTSQSPFLNIISGECTSCKVPQNPSNVENGEGYFLDEDLNGNNDNVKCIKSCPSGYYYKNNDNRCYKYDSSSIISDCYFIEGNFSVCFTSCQEIGSEYKYEVNHICYKHEVDCGSGYYYTSGNNKICVNNDEAISKCTSLNFNYLRDKECVEKCNKDEYIILPQQTIYDGVIKLGLCCQTPNCGDSSKNYYYSEDDKILKESCTLKTIRDGDGTDELISPKGNCVSDCPENYYETEDGKYCTLNCGSENYYYMTGDKKKCLKDGEKCKDINRFFFEGDKECLTNCSKKINNDLKYYYYDDNNDNICYTSCQETDNKFSLPINNFHQKCLSNCPSGFKYYYDNDKICLSSCDDGFYKTRNKGGPNEETICVKQCDSPEYIVDSNNQCTSTCDYFIATIPHGDLIINKCVKNCFDYEFNFFYEDNDIKRCYKECPPGTYEKGIECVDSCPSGYFTESNKCKNQCKETTYYVQNEDESKGDYICVPNCDLTQYYVSTTKECVKTCGIGENFIGRNRKCKNKCDENEDGKYYKKISEDDDEYEIYLCMQNYLPSSNEYLVDEENEIVSECPDTHPYLSSNGNICYSQCNKDILFPFSTEEESSEEDEDKKKICSFECKGNKLNYLKDEKVCKENCDSYLNNNIINDEDNSCVSECDTNSLYRYLTIDDNNKMHCSKNCWGKTPKQLNDSYVCVSGCLAPDNYVYENKCYKKCPEGKFALYDEENNDYKCVEQCDNERPVYYEKDDYKKCIKKIDCHNKGDYIIDGLNICISDCSLIKDKEYHFYESDKNYDENQKQEGDNEDQDEEQDENINYNLCVTKCPEIKPFLMKENNHCAKRCNPQSYKYYLEEDNICREKCPSHSNKIQEKIFIEGENNIVNYICRSECPEGTFLDEVKNECISSCLESTYLRYFYYPPYNTCKDKCDEGYFKNGFACVKSCPGEVNDEQKKNIYIGMNNQCVDKCPQNLNFVVKEFTHEKDKDRLKICDNKCPDDYPYYYHIEDDNDNINECVAECKYFILPENENFKSIECFKDKCPENYNFYIEYENLTIQCLQDCPIEMPYYVPRKENQDAPEIFQCYENCPVDYNYISYSSYLCKKDVECETKIIDYDEKKCVTQCKSNQYKATKGDITFCLNRCNTEFGEFHSINKECVTSCEGDYMTVDITDPLNKKCECQNLFYVNEQGIKKCLRPDQLYCDDAKNIEVEFKDYIYRIYNTKECVKYCFGFLSPSKDICYTGFKSCSEIDNNTHLVIEEEDKLICDCKYRFYQYPVYSGKIVKNCLGENDECSFGSYYMYTPKTKECVIQCNDENPIIFDDNKCFDECPIIDNTAETSEACKCDEGKFLVKISEIEYKCENLVCTSEYPYRINETKRCVKKCLGTGYEVLYKNECRTSCDIGMKIIEIDEDDKLREIAKFTCQCATTWYYDNGEIKCLTDNLETNCILEGFKYTIMDTKECVNSCPDLYYYFNDQCFKSCSEAKNVYQLPVKVNDNDEGSYECICENLWKQTINGDTKVVTCLTEVSCEKFMKFDTKECVDDCDDISYPLKYNHQCYKRGKCPEGTIENNIEGECKCEKVWYKQENDNLNCIDSDKCPDSHPYKNYKTNECTSDPCTDDTFKLNNTCYETCPEGTLEKEKTDGTKICQCDPEYGFWYLEENEKENMICGLSNCNITGDKTYYNNNTKQCLSSCEKYELYELNHICYENECPYPTVSENVITNKYECTVKKYTTATNLDESYKYIRDEIVQLYKSVPKGGIVYNNFESTLQIYGIKKNKNDTKELNLRSSLSYIDINPCLNKIYENNKMLETDDIVVVKYDLGNQKTKSLVNPVEYEFINSRTGQVLDMSVCKKEDIFISYSLSDILNFNAKSNERNLEEDEKKDNEISEIILDIQKQYKKGKEIYYKYKQDTFNINSTLYNDKCFSFEIDGKDLVLEDRVKYLYPYYSLCEANCTYSYTDFELERIYCNCPLKSALDFNREQKFVENENNIDDIKSKQKGPTNIPVMECISKLSEKEKITKNSAFFYSLVITILEIILFFFTIFYCYKILKNKICKNNLEQKEKDKEINSNISNIKEDEKVYKTSERNLSSPPKKRELKINGNENNNDIDNIINPNEIKIEEKIKEINNNKINNLENDGTATEDPRLDVDENNNESFSKEYELGILNEIKKEEKVLRLKYELAVIKDKADIFITLITEICDKIYLIKILILLGKYDMFSIYYSVYLLYHLILFTMITCFYDIKTIQNIWNKENYPNLAHDLGYGLLAALIVWVIYRIFLCIINNDTIINKYMNKSLTKSTTSENSDLRENNKMMNKLVSKIRNGMIIYFIIELIAVILCLLYVTTFSAIYIGTKAKVFKTYLITLVELLIIKIVYGIILGILRKIGLDKKIKTLYKIAYYFDRYIY